MSWIITRALLDCLLVLFLSTWIIFPAYVANAVAVPLDSARRGMRAFHPIDGGRMLGGQRLLGDGKTIEGFLLAMVIGIVAGFVQWLLSPLFLELALTWHDFYNSLFLPRAHVELLVSQSLANLVRIACLPAGAMSGDLLGSFVKRRLGKPRGTPFPVVDQLDFIAGAWLLSLLAWPAGGSLAQVPLVYLLVVACITPGIHVLVNKLAFDARLKVVPH